MKPASTMDATALWSSGREGVADMAAVSFGAAVPGVSGAAGLRRPGAVRAGRGGGRARPGQLLRAVMSPWEVVARTVSTASEVPAFRRLLETRP
ncbi:hypothetical protein GCM10018987_36880 [Streptomyces cremeus]